MTSTPMLQRVILLTALLLLPFEAIAAPVLNGVALHSQLGEDQFLAAVYSEETTKDARELLVNDVDKTMELRILADRLYSRRFKRMWIEGAAINAGSDELERQAQNLADFANMLRIKLERGDIVRMERHAGENMEVFINNSQVGQIEDPAFFDLLLRTWVGPVPLSTDFKESLLAGGDVDEQLNARFASVQPSQDRLAATANMIRAADTEREEANEVATGSPKTPPQPKPQPADKTVSPAETKPAQPRDRTDVKTAGDSGKQSDAAPAKQTKPSRLKTEEDLFADEEIPEDEEDFTFTAANVLSEQLYISKLTRWTRNFVRYPQSAVRRDQEGTVRLTVTLYRDGKIKDITYMEKSEHDILNEAARAAAEQASPYPAMPADIDRDTFSFTVPVVFRLR